MEALRLSRNCANAAAERLKLYAQPQRLMILACLLQGERSVGDIEEFCGVPQPALSQQLAELRRAGLVATRRVAKQVLYRHADAAATLATRCVTALFCSATEDMRALSAALAAQPAPASAKTSATKSLAGAAAFATVEARR